MSCCSEHLRFAQVGETCQSISFGVLLSKTRSVLGNVCLENLFYVVEQEGYQTLDCALGRLGGVLDISLDLCGSMVQSKHGQVATKY